MKLKVEWIAATAFDCWKRNTYFPAVFDAIDAAEREVLIETFILFEDRIGRDLQHHLIGAATRGVELQPTEA